MNSTAPRSSARRRARASESVQQHAVGQIGEVVVLGQVRHLQRHQARFADVVQYHDAADHRALAAVDRRGRVLHRGFAAVLACELAVHLQRNGAIFADGDFQRVERGLARFHVDQSHHLDKRTAKSIFLAPSCHLGSDGIHHGDAQLHVARDHGVANGIEHHLRLVHRLEQHRLGVLARGDVDAQRVDAAHPAINQMRHIGHVDHPAVVQVQLLLDVLPVETGTLPGLDHRGITLAGNRRG